MKKWGMGLFGLGVFGMATLSACGKPSTSAWYDSWCKARSDCGMICAECVCQHSSSDFQARYDSTPACKASVDAFRQCRESPSFCGEAGGDNCGGFSDQVLLKCFCGDGACSANESSVSCPADCGTS